MATEERAGDAPARVTTTTSDPSQSIRGGIRCPHCFCPMHEVTHTWQSESNYTKKPKQYIRRRRVCRYCGLSFNTREVIEPELPDKVETAKQVKEARKAIEETLRNVLPRDLPDLPNPFL